MSLTKSIFLLLVTVFLKEVVFSALIPIWHTPDEQAHFAQVSYFAETGKMPLEEDNLNREIYQSEVFLGTERDEKGNNKFTFHPEYRIEYTDNLIGKYESQIKNFPIEYRKNFVKQEASNYPPLYYVLSAGVYNLFYESDLISRIYAIRFLSIVLYLGLIFISFLIAKELFTQNSFFSLLIPVVVAFHPMLSFVAAGVNSDNLFNLLFSLLIYLSILLIKSGFQLKIIMAIILNLILMFYTKPQFVLGIPILLLAILINVLIVKKVTNKLKITTVILIVSFSAMVFLLVQQNNFIDFLRKFPFLAAFHPGFPEIEIGFIDFFKQTLRHTIAEVIPWYWGVFNWLGVVLPRDVNRVINRIMILAAIGLLLKMVLMIKKLTQQDWLIIFTVASAAIYFLGITYYNYLFTLSHGFPFGIQGRYYFPTIVPQMIILVVGLAQLIPNKFKNIKGWYFKVIAVLMIVLNFIALYTIAGSYYNLSSFNLFITQVSQYKIALFKGNLLVMFMIMYLILLGVFLINILRKPLTKLDGK